MHFARKISTEPFPGLRVKTFSILSVIMLITFQETTAQLSDDFSDGNLTLNPAWHGSSDNFIINSAGELQLKAPAAGTSWLSAEFTLSADQSARWDFYLKQSSAPSSANHGRFYLTSDQQDLSGPLNGYFLQFGEAGSADAVALFRQSGTVLQSIGRATEGAIASPFAVRVRVTRDGNGYWELLVDYSGKSDLVLEASVTDNTHGSSLYSGLLFSYTITNTSRFFFDDLSVTLSDAQDTTLPTVDSVNVLTAETLLVSFSEEVDSVSAENKLNYLLVNTSEHPKDVQLQSGQRSVLLDFASAFPNGYHQRLRVHGIKDTANNALADTVTSILFFTPSPVFFKDILLTEIMADPTPPVGLPEAEFVELYNRGAHPVDLFGWSVSDASTTVKLGHFILLPGKYAIVTTGGERFSSYGDVLHAALPGLNNSGDILTLKDDEGKTIDSVNYSRAWYGKSDAQDGGWSLELIDPQNICAGDRNWAASEAESGGTPGQANSVLASMPDNMGPRLTSVTVLDSVTIEILFDEKLEAHIPSAGRFITEPPLQIKDVRFTDASLLGLTITLDQPIRSGTEYSITVSHIYDCSGNVLQNDFSISGFILPEEALPGDIVINEILFNPRPTGTDFIELFNRSGKTLSLRDWSVSNVRDEKEDSVRLSGNRSIIRPHEYRVLTADADALKGEYVMTVEENLLHTDLPPFKDEDGYVIIRDCGGILIDSLYYSEDQHGPFIRDPEGVSLERISSSATTTEPENWASASSVNGFATPGYLNSNARMDVSYQDPIVVEPEIIQPHDHTRAFTMIRYRFERGGLVANVKIVDQQGREVRRIASNELLGTEGFFRWDGDLANGSPARTGYYLVWIEVYDVEGTVKTFKKRLAIF